MPGGRQSLGSQRVGHDSGFAQHSTPALRARNLNLWATRKVPSDGFSLPLFYFPGTREKRIEGSEKLSELPF